MFTFRERLTIATMLINAYVQKKIAIAIMITNDYVQKKNKDCNMGLNTMELKAV
jgi:hypothetical protein